MGPSIPVAPSFFNIPAACPRCGSLLGALSNCSLPELCLSPITSKVHDQISSCETAIMKLEEEMFLLQSQLSHIREIKELCIRKLEECPIPVLQPPSTSVSRIPNELLSEIFAYAVCQYPIEVVERRDPIWDILQVCSRWRSVARDTPILWCNFRIAPIHSEVTYSTMVVRIQQCLEYSGSLPLEITLQPLISGTFPVMAIEDIVDNSSRWRSFSIGEGILDLITAAPNTIRERMEQMPYDKLRKLSIQGAGDAWYREGSFNNFMNALSVEEIHIQSISFTDVSYFPQWNTVKKLSIVSCLLGWGNGLYSALRSLPNLEELTWSKNVAYFGPFPPLTLPQLRTISFTGRDGGDSGMWPILTAPCLSGIRISEGVDVNSLFSMIQRSDCDIKSLTVNCIPNATILQIIKGLHHVEELSLIDLIHGHRLLPCLVWNSKRNSRNAEKIRKYLPALQKLTIKIISEVRGDILPSLMDIIRSRSAFAGGSDSMEPAHLSSLDYNSDVHTDGEEEYKSALSCLGEELKVNVSVRTQSAWESDSEK